MRKPILILAVALLLAGLWIGVGLLKPESPAVEPVWAQASYVGAEKCAQCHRDKFDEWQASGHAHKLRDAEEARLSGLPKPSYVKSWDDILFVIGGYRWKARYVGQDGFIITQSEDGSIQGQNQFNLETRKFSDYHAGEVKPYSCGSCHNTGYNPEGNQMGLPGLVGTWALQNIQCEACHGPGSEHASGPSKDNIQIDTSSALCGQCHSRGDDMSVIPAKGGFIRHHEQYQELLQSPHKNLGCVTCHDPHETSGLSIKTECATCHPSQATEFAGSDMDQAGVTCTDCHMPEASKSAVKRGPYEGDVMTHLFRINTDAKASQFTDDGKFANGYLTLKFSCLPCHADRDADWAAQYAPQAHEIGK
jgi:hypothetical protein